MAQVVIFGVQDFAELAHFYLTNDSEHEVVAFTVHQQYMPETKRFHNLPVIPFEEVEQHYPPSAFRLFAPMSPRKMNELRTRIYRQIKEKGYELISYISSKATTFPGLQLGDNCFILEDNTIQPFTTIGNNVVLWSGNHIGHHSQIGDHVFFTSHVVLSGHCRIGPSCFLGVNATLRDGLELGEGTLVGMGAVLGKSTEPWTVWVGNPARKSEVSSKDANI